MYMLEISTLARLVATYHPVGVQIWENAGMLDSACLEFENIQVSTHEDPKFALSTQAGSQ